MAETFTLQEIMSGNLPAVGGAGFRVELIGLGNVVAALAGLGPRAAAAAESSLTRELERIFIQTQHEVPVDTSALKNTGQIEESDMADNGELTQAIAYGGDGVDYALIVHEDLMARHEPPTKAKYVEDPMNEAAPGTVRRMADSISSALSGGQVSSGGFTGKSGSWLRGKTGFIGSTRGV